jgi:hypothetical protein
MEANIGLNLSTFGQHHFLTLAPVCQLHIYQSRAEQAIDQSKEAAPPPVMVDYFLLLVSGWPLEPVTHG